MRFGFRILRRGDGRNCRGPGREPLCGIEFPAAGEILTVMVVGVLLLRLLSQTVMIVFCLLLRVADTVSVAVS